jgi:hypothetical protein
MRRPITPEYNLWRKLKVRGHVLCDRWLHSFDAFLDDVGMRPSDKHRLALIDESAPWMPGNAIWMLPMKKWGKPLYYTWKGMIARCHNVDDAAYRLYGARRIAVCDQWRKSFEAFAEDVGPKPSAQHTIDRIDNDRGYEPGNVRWATAVEQSNNRRFITRLTVDGETLSANAWARRYRIGRHTIMKRINAGWSHEQAVKTPVDVRRGAK